MAKEIGPKEKQLREMREQRARESETKSTVKAAQKKVKKK